MEGSQVLERTFRFSQVARGGFRARAVRVALVWMVRTVLIGYLGLCTIDAQTIRPDDLTVLMAADAVHKGSLKTSDMGPAKTGWVESWDSSGSLSWTAKVTATGSYALFAILQGSGTG